MAETIVKRIVRIIKTGRPIRLILAHSIGSHFEYKNLTFGYSDFLLTLDKTRLSQYCWAFGPEYRKNDIDLMRSFLGNGGIFVDAGSNIGTLTLAGSKIVGKNGVVYSFEPHPKTFKRLCNNLDVNTFSGNVKKYNFGLGAEPAVLNFSDLEADDQNYIDNDGSVRVAVTSLDEIFSSETTIDLLKIDVEGYELFVLKGADRIIQNIRTIILEVSVSHFARFGYAVPDVLKWLDEKGFHLIDEEGESITLDYRPSKTCNIIAFR